MISNEKDFVILGTSSPFPVLVRHIVGSDIFFAFLLGFKACCLVQSSFHFTHFFLVLFGKMLNFLFVVF
jgi:hypothetical protein